MTICQHEPETGKVTEIKLHGMNDPSIYYSPRVNIPITIPILWRSRKNSRMMTFLDNNDGNLDSLARCNNPCGGTNRGQLNTNHLCKLALGNPISKINDSVGKSICPLSIFPKQTLHHTFRVGDDFHTMSLVGRDGGIATSKGIDTSGHGGKTCD